MTPAVKIITNLKEKQTYGDLDIGQIFKFNNDHYLKLHNVNEQKILALRLTPYMLTGEFNIDAYPDEIIEGDITITVKERIKN